MTAGSAIGGFFGGIGKILGSVFAMLFWKLRITITAIILIYYIIGAVNASISQESIKPLVIDIGGRIVSADETLYWQLNEIEENEWRLSSDRISVDEKDGFWRDLKSTMAKFGFFFDIFSTLWFLYILWYVIFLFIVKTQDSAKLIAAVFAVLVMIALQALYGVSMLYLNDNCDDIGGREGKLLFALSPLKGCIKLGVNIANGNLINEAFLKSAVPFDIGLNMTNSTVES